MTWTGTQWDAFCGLVEEAWHGEFDEHTRLKWQVLLEGFAPESVVEGLRRLLLEGHQHRPSVSLLLAATRRDPSLPTFDEALVLIFGGAGIRGALRARPPHRVVYLDDPDTVPAGERRSAERKRGEAQRDAITSALAEIHPIVRTFVERQGIDRLRFLALDDPDWGEKRRADLERAYHEHVQAFDGREVAALASGGRGELAQLDPLAALGIRTDRPQLDAGQEQRP